MKFIKLYFIVIAVISIGRDLGAATASMPQTNHVESVVEKMLIDPDFRGTREDIENIRKALMAKRKSPPESDPEVEKVVKLVFDYHVLGSKTKLEEIKKAFASTAKVSTRNWIIGKLPLNKETRPWFLGIVLREPIEQIRITAIGRMREALDDGEVRQALLAIMADRKEIPAIRKQTCIVLSASELSEVQTAIKAYVVGSPPNFEDKHLGFVRELAFSNKKLSETIEKALSKDDVEELKRLKNLQEEIGGVKEQGMPKAEFVFPSNSEDLLKCLKGNDPRRRLVLIGALYDIPHLSGEFISSLKKYYPEEKHSANRIAIAAVLIKNLPEKEKDEFFNEMYNKESDREVKTFLKQMLNIQK
ncbi:MAG: hypothetical protein PHV34_20330 [Verrucomicrobiae bacterium]|nr:hypothetical protein [Verrucomicrobiae bacterium]